MIKYIKENLESILKLFINHVGMMIFGLLVLITAKALSSQIGNSAVYYIMWVITLLMYFSLIYTAMWERGARDKIKIDGGRMNKNNFHGLWCYLLGNVIAIITGAVCLVFSFFATEDVSFVNNVCGVFQIISRFYSSMYLPLLEIEGMNIVVLSSLCLGVVIPGAIVSFVSYLLGVKGFKCLFPEPKRDKNRKIR